MEPKKSKLILKGINESTGIPFIKEIHSLDEVKTSGTYIVIARNATSEENGFPKIHSKADCCFCCETNLVVNCCYNDDESQSTNTYGQELTISDKESNTTGTYKRTVGPAGCSEWLMVATGNIELIAQNNDIVKAYNEVSANYIAAVERIDKAEDTVLKSHNTVLESATVRFDRIEENEVTINAGVIDAAPTAIVYYKLANKFVACDNARNYWDTWEGMDAYMSGGKIRGDKVFVCNNSVYMWNNASLYSLPEPALPQDFTKVNISELTIKGKFLREDGTIGFNKDYGYIPPFYCRGLRLITFSRPIRRCLLMDNNKKVLSSVADNDIVVVPKNTYYISLTYTYVEELTITGVLYDNEDSNNPYYGETIKSQIYKEKRYINTEYKETYLDTGVIYTFEVSPLRVYSVTMYSYSKDAYDIVFFDNNNVAIGHTENSNYSIRNLIVTAPQNAVTAKISTRLSLPVSIRMVSDLGALSTTLDAMSAEYNSEQREYGLSDLHFGNIRTTPVGSSYETGELSNYRYGFLNCAEGQVCKIRTVGGVSVARGLAFYDANKVILLSSEGGELDETFIAPKGTTHVAVNIDIDQSQDFYLGISTLKYKVNSNTENIEKISNELEDIKKLIPVKEDSIQLFYGKDMFLIKDTPLDLYAKEVLLKNYPAYRAVYANNAPIIAAGSNYDFNLPLINHINPEGKVYFDDNAIVDIFADDGELYKDSWNVARNIKVHATDISTKQKSIKAMFIGSSTVDIGMATYVKKYLETLGIEMTACGSKNDRLGTKSEGWYGWTNAQICGKQQNSSSYPQTGISTNGNNPFMKLATTEDKANYPNRCYSYVEGQTGSRQSYAEATDKNQDFYIFDFAWYLKTREVETPDVVFFLLGLNDSYDSYITYMPWIIDRILQACPNVHIGINVCQAIRLESDADSKLSETMKKLIALYNWVNNKAYDKIKVVSLHAHQSPDFSHDFQFEDAKAIPIGGFLHMNNNGYLQNAKCIGAYIAYCLPNV